MKKVTIGAIIEEPGNSLQHKTGGWRFLKPVIDENKCIGCGTCYIYCPDAAIKIVEENGKRKAKINYDYCKGCGICSNVCPIKAIKLEKEE